MYGNGTVIISLKLNSVLSLYFLNEDNLWILQVTYIPLILTSVLLHIFIMNFMWKNGKLKQPIDKIFFMDLAASLFFMLIMLLNKNFYSSLSRSWDNFLYHWPYCFVRRKICSPAFRHGECCHEECICLQCKKDAWSEDKKKIYQWNILENLLSTLSYHVDAACCTCSSWPRKIISILEQLSKNSGNHEIQFSRFLHATWEVKIWYSCVFLNYPSNGLYILYINTYRASPCG